MTDKHLDRLARLDTCAVSDALDALNLPGAVKDLTALAAPRRIAGRAVTVDLALAGTTSAPGRHLGTAAVDASGPGDIIVVAHHARTHAAGWGGVLSRGAKRNGVDGVIVDGAARDIDEAHEVDLPVYARAAVPITARGRVVECAWAVPVDIAGVTVTPGDLVLADGSGVVFVAAAHADDVLDKAETIAARERAMTARIDAGEPMTAVMSADYEHLLDAREP